VLQVGTGGRWELPRDAVTAAFVEGVLEAVLAGRVTEVLGPGRAAVAVTLADGRVERTSVRDRPRGCLRLPRWRPGRRRPARPGPGVASQSARSAPRRARSAARRARSASTRRAPSGVAGTSFGGGPGGSTMPPGPGFAV
jgi:hypothetical protein